MEITIAGNYNILCMGYSFYTSLGDYDYFLSNTLMPGKSLVDSFIIIMQWI